MTEPLGLQFGTYPEEKQTSLLVPLRQEAVLEPNTDQFSSVAQSRVQLFAIPLTVARQASLSITNSRSLLKLMYIELVMPSNHLILCCPLFLLPSNLSQYQGLFQ